MIEKIDIELAVRLGHLFDGSATWQVKVAAELIAEFRVNIELDRTREMKKTWRNATPHVYLQNDGYIKPFDPDPTQ